MYVPEFGNLNCIKQSDNVKKLIRKKKSKK